jgi:RNA polymerase sigma factor (sigma-70 family)
MATDSWSEITLYLGNALPRRDKADRTDGELLECFVRDREQAALGALVQRHGRMGWGVCRRLLRDLHAAEDAFQATFLVLVRRAAAIVPREMVANWLYGVAHRTALKARATAAKRRTREKQVTTMPEPTREQQQLWDDLQPVLDRELSRLPAKYRAVLVVCDLEEKTRKEAAQRLGLPEGTVASRLARARVLLARRLVRCGLAVSGAALAVLLPQSAEAVPPSVVSSTIKAATALATGQAAAGAVSVKVAALTEGALKALFLSQLKVALVLMLVVALSGVAWLLYRTQTGAPAGCPPNGCAVVPQEATEEGGRADDHP